MSGPKNVLHSLAVYDEDSEPDTDNEAADDDPATPSDDEELDAALEAPLIRQTELREKGGLVSASYGEDDVNRQDGDRLDDDYEEDYYQEEDEEEDDASSKASGDEDSENNSSTIDGIKEVSEVDNKKDPQELVASFSEKVRNMAPDEIKIPPEPQGRCSNHLQEKIHRLYERKINEGLDMNSIIQRKKEFRNPSIYEKLIQFCGIDELGTNYPKDMFDPHGWSEDSFYEALAKAQKIEMDKMEKQKRERTKIEFVTGTKKGGTTTSTTSTSTTTASVTTADAQKRKSKWDSAVPVTTISQPPILTTTATLPAVVTVTTSASGSRTTVISAVGTIVKKSKQ